MGGFLVFLASDTTASSSKKQRSGRGSTHKRRRAKRLAWWQTLGPLRPGVKPRFLLGQLNDAEESRLGGQLEQGKLDKECRTLELTFQGLASKPRLTPINPDGSVHRCRS